MVVGLKVYRIKAETGVYNSENDVTTKAVLGKNDGNHEIVFLGDLAATTFLTQDNSDGF